MKPKIVKTNTKYDDIILKPLGRRPTNVNDIKGLLTLANKTDGNIAEVGVWDGRTTYEIATRFEDKKIFTFDYLENVISEREQNARCLKDQLCIHANMLDNVYFRYIQSKDINYDDYDNVSMIFIDADHSFEGVKSDSEKAIDYIEKRGSGIICWHDYGVPQYFISKYIDGYLPEKYQSYLFENTKVAYIEI